MNAQNAVIGTGVDFQWITSNGGTILNGANTLTPTVTNTGSYQLLLSGSGCEVDQVINLPDDIDVPNAIIDTPDIFQCSNYDFHELDGSSSTQSESFDYYWSTPDGDIPDFQRLDPYLVEVLSAGTYWLTIINRETGCSDSASVELEADPFFNGEEQFMIYADHGGNYLGCEVDEVQLKVLTSHEEHDLQYIWSTFDGNFVSPTNIQAPIIDEPGFYSVEVADLTKFCFSSIGFYIREYVPPVALEFSVSSPLSCNKSSIELEVEIIDTNIFNRQPYFYEWSTADGVILNNQNGPNPLIGSPGTYSVTVTAMNGGCTKEGSVVVEDRSVSPEIAMPQNASLTCQTPSLQLDLSGSSTGPHYCYTWETSDGQIESAPNVLHPTISQPGTYTLTIGDLLNGCTSQQDVIVSGSNELPVASTVSNVSMECGESSVFLNGNGSSAGSGFNYEWTTFDGQIISGGNTLAPEVTSAGQYLLTVTALNGGCTGTSTVQVADNRYTVEENISAEICADESYQLGGQIFDQTGEYEVSFLTYDGCDSIVHLNLDVLPVPMVNMEVSICSGDSYFFGDQDLTTEGVYVDTSQASNGCDSMTYLQFEVLETSETMLEATICSGEIYTVGATDYDETGIYVDTIVSSFGCDSIVVLKLDVTEHITEQISASICEGDVFSVGNSIYSLSGTYVDTLSGFSGCDSIVTLQLEVLNQSSEFVEAEICEGEGYQFGNSIYTASGTYSDTLKNVNGCDSTILLELTVQENSFFEITTTICEGENIVVGNVAYDSTGIYLDTISNISGCDSFLLLDLKVIPEMYINDTLIQADNGTGNGSIEVILEGGMPPYAYAWSNGKTGNIITDLIAANYSVTIEDAGGCIQTFSFEVTLQTSTDEPFSSAFQLSVYPNPVSTFSGFDVQVISSQNTVSQISLVDILGRRIMKKTVRVLVGKNIYEMPGPIPCGVYIIAIENGNQIIAAEKMIVVGS